MTAPDTAITVSERSQGALLLNIAFPPFALGQERIVSQVAVVVTPGTTSTKYSFPCKMLFNNQLVTWSPMMGNQDTAGGDPPLRVRASDSLVIQVQEDVPPEGFVADFQADVTFYYSVIPTPRGQN